MKTFKSYLDERCWKGYKPVPGKKPYSPGSCKKEDIEIKEDSVTELENGLKKLENHDYDTIDELMQKIAKKAFRAHPKGFLSRYTVGLTILCKSSNQDYPS